MSFSYLEAMTALENLDRIKNPDVYKEMCTILAKIDPYRFVQAFQTILAKDAEILFEAIKEEAVNIRDRDGYNQGRIAAIRFIRERTGMGLRAAVERLDRL